MKSKKSASGGRASKKDRAPSQRVPATLAKLARVVPELGARWMLIGGCAVVAYGVRRMTEDVDIVVRGDEVTAERALEVLGRHGIVPRIRDAAAFARESLVLLLRDAENDVNVDLSFAWSAFEHAALDAPASRRVGTAELPTATAEALVVYKVIAGRPKDVDDAQTLLLLYPRLDKRRVRRWVADLAEIAGDPEYVARLESVLVSAKAKPKRAR